LEDWNNGVIKNEKALLLVQERFAEARGKGLLAFSLKSAAGGRSSNLYQGKIPTHEPIIPVFHYSNVPSLHVDSKIDRDKQNL